MNSASELLLSRSPEWKQSEKSKAVCPRFEILTAVKMSNVVQSVLLQRVSVMRECVHKRWINRGIKSPKCEIVLAHTRFFTHTTQHFVLRMMMSFLPPLLHNSEATTLHHTHFRQANFMSFVKVKCYICFSISLFTRNLKCLKLW
jgi:hypothetical protein